MHIVGIMKCGEAIDKIPKMLYYLMFLDLRIGAKENMKMSLKTTYVSGNCLIRIMVRQDDSKMYHSSQEFYKPGTGFVEIS